MDGNFAGALVEYLRTAPAGKALCDWRGLEEVHTAYQRLAREYLDGLRKPANLGSGRGIVTAGGGLKFFPSLVVLLASLKAVGCKLPVEIWYYGDEEMDPRMKSILEKMGHPTLRDASQDEMRIKQGWQIKTHAINQSAFKEVIYIDADNSVVRDPEHLFDLPEYRDAGALFWPDFSNWIEHPLNYVPMVEKVYSAFGLPLPENIIPPVAKKDGIPQDHELFGKKIPVGGYDWPFESGQYVVDRDRCWLELALADWYCQHSDFYFHLVHGDKECLHFAWRVLGTKYHLAPILPDWDKHTALQFGFDGKPLFEHRNKANFKWRLGMKSSGSRCLNEPLGVACMEKLSEIWNGHLWFNPHPTTAEKAVMDHIGKCDWHYHRVDVRDSRLLELKPNGQIGNGSARHERYWSIWDVDQRRVMAIGGDEGVTTLLEKNGDGGWHGKWFRHEQSEVDLFPARRRK